MALGQISVSFARVRGVFANHLFHGIQPRPRSRFHFSARCTELRGQQPHALSSSLGRRATKKRKDLSVGVVPRLSTGGGTQQHHHRRGARTGRAARQRVLEPLRPCPLFAVGRVNDLCWWPANRAGLSRTGRDARLPALGASRFREISLAAAASRVARVREPINNAPRSWVTLSVGVLKVSY